MDKMIEFLRQSLDRKVVESVAGGEWGTVWHLCLEDGSSYYLACAWRLEKEGIPLLTEWHCFNQEDEGRLSKYTKMLEGRTLQSVELSSCYDMTLCFDEGYCISVFCNTSYCESSADSPNQTNWEYDCKPLNKVLRISNYFEVVWEDLDD